MSDTRLDNSSMPLFEELSESFKTAQNQGAKPLTEKQFTESIQPFLLRFITAAREDVYFPRSQEENILLLTIYSVNKLIDELIEAKQQLAKANISPQVLDKFIAGLIQKIREITPEDEWYVYFGEVAKLMQAGFNESAKIFLNSTDKIQFSDYRSNLTMSECLAILNSNKKEHESLIPLLAGKLLLDMHTTTDDISSFDFMRPSPNKKGFDLLVKNLQKNFDAKNYNWEKPLYFPVSLLTPAQHRTLKQKAIAKIEDLAVFKDNPELKKRFLVFLNDESSLNLNRLNQLGIAIECITLLVNPSWIKQGEANLCGPAIFMQNLIRDKPDMFVHSVIEIAELAKDEKTRLYLPEIVQSISPSTARNAYSLTQLWLETIKNNYNVMMGYDQESRFEKVTGQTTPYQLERMFQDFGYQIEMENMQVMFSSKSTFTNTMDLFRKHLFAPHMQLPGAAKFYGLQHSEQQSNDDRFKALCDWFEKNPKGWLPVLMAPNLVLRREWPDTLGIIRASHYVNLKDFEVRDNHVFYTCVTYGRELKQNYVTIDEFKKGYFGSLIADPMPTEKLTAAPSTKSP